MFRLQPPSKTVEDHPQHQIQKVPLPLNRDQLLLSNDSQSDEEPLLQTGTIRALLLRRPRESATMVADLSKLLKTSMERHLFKRVDPGQ